MSLRPSTCQRPVMPGVMSRRFSVQPGTDWPPPPTTGAGPRGSHVALHAVEDLRQLVEAPATQPVAEARQARIVVHPRHSESLREQVPTAALIHHIVCVPELSL